jgi:peptidylprolyl isomerase
VLDRLRRPALLLLPAVLVLTSACGGSDSEDQTAAGLDAVSISGDPGETPEVDWKAKVEPAKAETEVLEEGDGVELKKGDRALVNLYVANDATETANIDTFGEEQAGVVVEVGAKRPAPKAGADLLVDLVAAEIEPGTTLGTRIASAFTVDKQFEKFYYAFTDYDIGNADGVVIVADVESVVLDGPEGKQRPTPAWAPSVVETKGEPTSLDFSGTPKPGDKLRVATLVEGTGEEVAAGDAVVVDYLGQVWGGEKAFDDSYSRDATLSAVVGEGATGLTADVGTVVKGWNALIGVPVGSRVIVQIPPKLGYGKEGRGEDIKGTDTMFFVIDVLGAA